jgi:hypothetical protein
MLPGCAGYVTGWVGGELKNKTNLSQARARASLLGLSMAISNLDAVFQENIQLHNFVILEIHI